MAIFEVLFLLLAISHPSMTKDLTLQSYAIDPSSDPSFVDMGTVRITKKSRNLLVVSGSWELFQNIGDDVLYRWVLLMKSPLTGEFRPLMMQQQTFCDFIDNDTMMMPAIRKAANLPESGGCPFPKGKYTIDNFDARIPESLPLSPGDYMLRLSCISEGRQLLGLEWRFTVV